MGVCVCVCVCVHEWEMSMYVIVSAFMYFLHLWVAPVACTPLLLSV